MVLFGQCKCKEGKGCPVHFFKRVQNQEKYDEEVKKYHSKSKKREPEYVVAECKCDTCDCKSEKDCDHDCEDCSC